MMKKQKTELGILLDKIDEFGKWEGLGEKINPIYIDGAKEIARYCFKHLKSQGYKLNDDVIKRAAGGALCEMKNRVEKNPKEFVGELKEYTSTVKMHGYNLSKLSKYCDTNGNSISKMAKFFEERLDKMTNRFDKAWIYRK